MKLALFLEMPVAIQIHTIAALGALILGSSLLVLPKGKRLHQLLGITTAVLLFVTAASAMFIMHLNDGWPSVIHVFVPLTFFGLFGIVMGLARRDWKRHREAARGLIFGALMIPAIIAFMPGRLLHVMTFG